MALSPKQLITVVANKPKIESAIFRSDLVIRANAPIASIIPPKTMAQEIKRIVHIIPLIPPELNNSLSVSSVVVIDVSVNIAVIIALILESARLVRISG